MTQLQPIAVLGGGSFGTALANLLAENGQRVLQWMRDPEQAEAMRTQRDATLPMPKLILPSVQVNMNGGRPPEPEDNGVRYLKVPLNAL